MERTKQTDSMKQAAHIQHKRFIVKSEGDFYSHSGTLTVTRKKIVTNIDATNEWTVEKLMENKDDVSVIIMNSLWKEGRSLMGPVEIVSIKEAKK